MLHLQSLVMTKLKKWGKLFWPNKWLKYFPPVFVLRNPVIESVYSSMKKGNQVAVVVFKIANFNELLEEVEHNVVPLYMKKLQKNFEIAVKECLSDDEIISLHEYFNGSFVLFVKIDHSKKTVFEAEKVIKQIKSNLIKDDYQLYSFNKNMQLDAGYMFVEKNNRSIEQAIFMAYQQAITMAEKKAISDYNKMLYEITKIISRKQIELLAQPIIDVTSNEIKAVEILTRGPKGTSYEQPLQLFSIARQTNLLNQLELVVLEKAFQQILKTNCQHLVFINFTPITIGNPGFTNEVKKLLLKYHKINPNNIIIEVTEGDSIEKVKHFQKNIKQIRELGIRVAVDDTGSGYASLHLISEIMPDIIKIDRSVIKDIDKNNVKESMLKGLLLIAKETGSLVVAEGIEKQEEAKVLTRNNVDMAQGYYYAKPASMLTPNVS